MFLSHLHLTWFRNFQGLDLPLEQPLTVLQGPNGAGKTNLLDSICYLATSRSHKSQSDAQSVHVGIQADAIPYFEIAGKVVDRNGLAQTLRVYYGPREVQGQVAKMLQADGTRLRAVDLMGRLRAVLFIPADTSLIADGPGIRRRHLDITLCQIDRVYFQALLRYQRILRERNALLKNLRAAGQFASSRVEQEMHFWDGELVRLGGMVISQRAQWLQVLEEKARPYHTQMTLGQEQLDLAYRPSVRPPGSRRTETARDWAGIKAEEWQENFTRRLQETLSTDLARAATSVGPHRDDFDFRSNDLPLGKFGSRGQQRTAIVAYRLAEVEGIRARCQEAPLLLLDDVMSELDQTRQGMVVKAIRALDQVIVTTTDWTHYPDDFLDQAARWKVRAGTVQPA